MRVRLLAEYAIHLELCRVAQEEEYQMMVVIGFALPEPYGHRPRFPDRHV